MKTRFHPLFHSLISLALLSVLDFQNSTAFAQGTAFTYQGQLSNGTNPVTGLYNFKFDTFNAATGGSVIGGPVTNTAVPVTNGLFTTIIDFGTGVFTGPTNWLHVQVTTNGGIVFTSLAPRQELTPTPYAIFAEGANAAGLSGTIPAGVVPDSSLPSDVALTDANQTFTGSNSFSGLNASLTISGTGPISTSLFTGLGFQFYNGSGEGAIMSSVNDGFASLTFFTKQGSGYPMAEQVLINRYGVVAIDQQNNNSGVLNDGTTNGAGLTFGTGGTGSGEGIASQRTAGLNQYGLDFYTDFTHRMSILNNGNVGIGTTNPTTALQVNGTVTANAFSGNGGGLSNLSAAALPNTVVTNNEPNVTLGNLTLGGSLNIDQTGTYGRNNGTVTSNALTFGTGPGGSGEGIASQRTSGPNQFDLTLFTGFNPRVTVLASGNVGIGTTNPGTPLQVNGTVTASALALPLPANVSAGGNSLFYADNSYNFFAGPSAGNLATPGAYNTANGYEALSANNGAAANTADGVFALESNTTGGNNTALGADAMAFNINGSYNTAVGVGGLEANTSGVNNVAYGAYALGNSTDDENLVAVGYQALQNDNAYFVNNLGPGTISGFGENTAIGYQALQSDTFGYGNTALGSRTLASDTTGYFDTALGDNGLKNNGTGYENTAVGYNALTECLGGANNIALGYNAGVGLSSGNNNIYIGNAGNSSENGVIRIGTPGTQTQTYIAGTVSCPVISITGGSDLAEPFNISTSEQPVSEGAVVVIDEANPGQLKLTDRPYDTRVAGVVSGANGIHPGIQMHQQGILEGGRNVALTGRVYVQADTSNGAIKPGDLLTTSSTPGQAMKVTDHARAQGAILGKAMTGLREGKGMVLVLVTLQ